MSVYVVKCKKTFLKSPLSTTATSVILKELLTSKDANAVTADFGEYGVIVIKQGDTIEMIKFTSISTAADGTATLTVASNGRHLNPTQPYAGSSTGLAFQSGAEVIVTNDPLTVMNYMLENANTWNEIQTFAALPATTAGNPVANNDLARKAYVDSVVAGIATTVNVVVPGTAGETIAVGNLIYFDDTENEWMKCDADTAATVENVLLGIAQGAGTNGVAITGGVLLRGLDANQTGLTAAALYYASNTAGAISSSAGTKEVTVGFSYSTTQLYFNPRFNQQLTEDEQDALAGTQGTPSASNKFQTGSGSQRQTPVYAASAVGTDSYAITVTPAVSTYVAGMRFSFLADVANTGAATLAVGTGAAKAIKKHHDQDVATGDIEANQVVEVAYDAVGDVWQMQSQLAVAPALPGDIQSFTSTGAGTWTKPTAGTPKKVLVQVWGAGGSGARFDGASSGAGGGGGGGYSEKWFAAADLAATEAVSVGAGGAAKAIDGVGNTGGNTTFGTSGTLVTAYGGGGGGGDAVSGDNGAGGGGGGLLGAGGAGASASAGTAGSPGAPIGTAGSTNTAGIDASHGAGGGGSTTSARTGGNAYYGGAGGGGCRNSGAAAGGASKLGGAGGAGHVSAAVAGSQPGGGGGGAAGTSSGSSGAGGDGKVVVTTFY